MKQKIIYITLVCLFALPLWLRAQNVGIGTTTPTDQFHTTGSVRFEKYKGTGVRPLQVDDSGRVVVASAGAVYTNATALSIPDNGCVIPSGAVSSIAVSGMPAAVPSAGISVQVNITHPFDGDVKIFLYAPNGQMLMLSDGNGSTGANYTNTRFTDAAATNITNGAAPFTGTFKPEGGILNPCVGNSTSTTTFSAIGGGSIVPNGTWILEVSDDADFDAGILQNWSISFSGASPFEVAGNSNHIARFNATGGLQGSNIIQNPSGGYIGISANSSFAPAYGLDVDGTVHAANGGSFDHGIITDTLFSSGASTIGGTLRITGGSPGAGKVLTSDASGGATWQASAAAPVGFGIYKTNGDITVPVTGPIWTKVAFNSFAQYNQGTAYSPANSEFVAPASGVYRFDIKLLFESFAGTAINAGSITIALYMRNAGDPTGNPWYQYKFKPEISASVTEGFSVTVPLSANDIIDVRVYNTANGTIILHGPNESGLKNYFSGYRVF